MRAFILSKGTFAVLTAAAAITAGAARAAAVQGVISSTPAMAGEYCHLKFPAIRPSTLGSDHPQLKAATTGDIVDYYGPCNHDPLGKDEVIRQKQEEELRQARDYDR